ncbi:MAG TPA: DUF3052 domain-containing protein [Dermatophilaceae bacterium]|nr:DUF3052 domain-containing protein [Dermatophilaceae bacterium]
MDGPAQAGAPAALARLGVTAGQVVQELGWDDDTDEELRSAIEGVSGTPLEDEGYGDGADVVLLWHRAEDGDLVDTLVDALTNLVDRGLLLLATPRAGQDGHVEPSDIEDAALSAGLHVAGGANLSRSWALARLVAPRGQRR